MSQKRDLKLFAWIVLFFLQIGALLVTQFLSACVIFYSNTIQASLINALIMILLACVQFLGSRYYSWHLQDVEFEETNKENFLFMEFDTLQFMYIHKAAKVLYFFMGVIYIFLIATWDEIIEDLDKHGTTISTIFQLYIYLGLLAILIIVTCGYSCYRFNFWPYQVGDQ